MSYDRKEDVPPNRCGTELKDGTYCGLFSLNVFFHDVSDRCCHHFYLDGEEAIKAYEKATE